ncbi:unnamed protein product [Lupinus luteus]|uniref:Uncharacterized protein n=1 Tax=Lupinus luteus TaxID=3873 RepID=A0AAV1X0G4_LUPLU
MSHATPRLTVRFAPDGDLLPTLDPRVALDDGDNFYEDQRIEFQSDPILGFQIDRTGVHHNLLASIIGKSQFYSVRFWKTCWSRISTFCAPYVYIEA